MRQYCLVLLLITSLAPLRAQDTTALDEAPEGASSEDKPLPEGAPSPEGAGKEGSSSDLVRETLLQDIQTAGYYELLAWCRELGLDDSGGRKELRDRLLAYYRREPGEEEEKASRLLQIKSARDTEYFRLQEVEEDYVMLQGNVLVELVDEDAVHRIRAERIVLNQTEDLLTAVGDVEYHLTRGEEEQLFKGNKLTFNVKTWEGVFFRGGMESETEIEGKNLRFLYSGESISKLENDTVVLEKGIITSSKPKEPYYHLRAKKIWVLAPGEWAVWQAVLYVGRIPLLYVPFFFLPGDEFFFHPVLGYRDREGNFLQTTTYLLGQKQQKKRPLSFLAAMEDSSAFKREIRGLFLRQTEEKYPAAEKNRYLKLLLDGYTRLGGFLGIEGDFPPQVSFRGGIGFSRSLFLSQGVYTPFWPEDGVYRSYWHRSWLFGARLPFRYGLEADWNLGREAYQFSGLFEFYSDPYFWQDFFNRAEDIDWSGILALEEEEAESSTIKQNLSWIGIGKADFSALSSIPQLHTLSIPYFNAELYWQSRNTKVITALPELADPTRLFYYPVSLKLPSTALQVAGTLLDLQAGRPVEAEDPSEGEPSRTRESPGKGYRPPLGEEKAGATREEESAARDSVPTPAADSESLLPSEQRSAASERPFPSEQRSAGPGRLPPSEQRLASSDTGPFRLPKPKEDLPDKLGREPTNFQLGYQVFPSLIVEQTFDSDDWDKQSDVDFIAEYTALETTASTSLDCRLKMLRELFDLSGRLIYSGTYRTRFRGAYHDDAQWESLVFGDNKQTRSEFQSSSTLKLFPLLEVESLEQSTLSHNLDWTFYRILLNESLWIYGDPVYYGIGPEWKPETVKKHIAEAAFIFQPYRRPHSLTFSAQLPPLTGSLTGRLTFYLWLLKTTIQSVFRETAEGWRPDPLILQEILEVNEQANYSQELRYDTESKLLLKSISSLSLYGFYASFTAERLKPIHFVDGVGWQQTGEEKQFLPANLKIGYQLLNHPWYLWKNRLRFELALDTSWYMNLQEFTQNSLDSKLSLNLFIYKFLELTFSTTAFNRYTYRYFPGLANRVGEDWVNPLEDLFRSFNLVDVRDRYRSAFNLKDITLAAVHHLHDWDLTLTYQGKPELVTGEGGKLQYQWKSSFSIFLQWIPIPELKSRLKDEGSGFKLRG